MLSVGWIGLGAMGLGMARSAARAGHRVIGHTRGKPEHNRLVEEGGTLSPDLGMVVADADVVCINVFSAEQVREVLYGQRVLERLASGVVLILHTTSDPAFARQLGLDAPAGVEVVDAAFSG